MDDERFRWRKATDISRRHALFELIDGDHILLDVGFSDLGVFEITFHQSAAGLTVAASDFDAIVAKGRQLAELDK